MRGAFGLVLLALTAGACAAGERADLGAEPSTTALGGSGGAGGFHGVTGGEDEIKTQGGALPGSSAVCGEASYASFVGGHVLIVLDRSGSMASDTPNKWTPTRNAVNSMLNQANDALHVGLLPFPAGEFDEEEFLKCSTAEHGPNCAELSADGGCRDVAEVPPVPLGPIAETRVPIKHWMAEHEPAGGTPTLWALRRAYEYMRSLDIDGERFVVLLTDGAPQVFIEGSTVGSITIPPAYLECKELTDIAAETQAAAEHEVPVRTFVIGSPGDEETIHFLSKLAVLGGTRRTEDCVSDCHYQLGKTGLEVDMTKVLNEIADKAIDCVFQLPNGDDVDPNKVNVVVETPTETLELSRDVGKTDGWDYVDSTHTAVHLYGPACDAYNVVAVKVSITTGCATRIK